MKVYGGGGEALEANLKAMYHCNASTFAHPVAGAVPVSLDVLYVVCDKIVSWTAIIETRSRNLCRRIARFQAFCPRCCP